MLRETSCHENKMVPYILYHKNKKRLQMAVGFIEVHMISDTIMGKVTLGMALIAYELLVLTVKLRVQRLN